MTTARIRTFKDLLVWQKAFELAVEVYRLTRRFASDEHLGLTAELGKTPFVRGKGMKGQRTQHLSPSIPIPLCPF